jgi:mono/diheme cytochrome c family protein
MTLGLIGMGTGGLYAADATSGEALFAANCTACHVTQHPEDESTLKAPPIMGAVRHVKEKYPTKEAAVKFMVDYIQNPAKEKAACEPRSIERFGLMPSLKGAVSPEDLEKIAAYVYDTYPNGQGKGRGHGHGKHRGHGKGHGMHGQGHGRHGQ